MPTISRKKSRRHRGRRLLFAGLLCSGGALAAGAIHFFGHHHVVAGTAVGGIAIVPKANFSMAEVFVDHDTVRQLSSEEARAASPGYTTLLAALDGEEIERSRMNAQRGGPSSEIVAGMTGAEVEALLGKPEILDRTSDDSEVRHYGPVLVLMENDRVLKVLR